MKERNAVVIALASAVVVLARVLGKVAGSGRGGVSSDIAARFEDNRRERALGRVIADRTFVNDRSMTDLASRLADALAEDANERADARKRPGVLRAGPLHRSRSFGGNRLEDVEPRSTAGGEGSRAHRGEGREYHDDG